MFVDECRSIPALEMTHVSTMTKYSTHRNSNISQVLYNLFEWPLRRGAQLAVIGVANTMDLPERLLPRIARCGLIADMTSVLEVNVHILSAMLNIYHYYYGFTADSISFCGTTALLPAVLIERGVALENDFSCGKPQRPAVMHALCFGATIHVVLQAIQAAHDRGQN